MMREIMKRGFQVVCCMALAAAITLTGIQTPTQGGGTSSTVAVSKAASTTGRVPVWAYMKNSSGRLNTYTTSSLRTYTGYIEPGDYCKILAFYSNGAVRVSYPTARGARTTYAAMSGFTATTNFNTRTRTLGSAKTAYRRSSGSATIGSVYASDQVIVLGTANGRTQVQYPCPGGYKIGWVSGTYSPGANSGTAQKIVNYELSQVGIGDTRGNNNVKYNTWYYGRQVSGSGYAWCMAFQSYCAAQTGLLNTAVPKTASCAVAVNWYKNKGKFRYAKYYGGSYTPKAGDLVFYYSGGSFCHVGMITGSPVNGYLQTVEGNILCSDGNWKVVRFTKNSKRTVNNSYVYGYGILGS